MDEKTDRFINTLYAFLATSAYELIPVTEVTVSVMVRILRKYKTQDERVFEALLQELGTEGGNQLYSVLHNYKNLVLTQLSLSYEA